MKHLRKKLKGALLILVICLIAFISFSKAGILFSVSGGDVITVSTTKKTFEPNMYVASVVMNMTERYHLKNCRKIINVRYASSPRAFLRKYKKIAC